MAVDTLPWLPWLQGLNFSPYPPAVHKEEELDVDEIQCPTLVDSPVICAFINFS